MHRQSSHNSNSSISSEESEFGETQEFVDMQYEGNFLSNLTALPKFLS